MSLYRVIGDRAYREHQPGELFEAVLPLDAEQRAVQRRAIEIVDVRTPTLQPGSFTAPPGWPFKQEE